MRIPVHQPLAAIDIALAVEIDENLDHRVVEIALGIRLRCPRRPRHGEGIARPVTGRTEALQLINDRIAVLRLPLPDLAEEILAAHIRAAQVALRLQLLLDLQLRGDPRMVLPRLPQRVKAAHPVPTGEDILQRVVERMAHMQRAGDVRRRDHDAETLGPRLGIGARLEGARLLPHPVEPRFGLGRIKILVHRHRSDPRNVPGAL